MASVTRSLRWPGASVQREPFQRSSLGTWPGERERGLLGLGFGGFFMGTLFLGSYDLMCFLFENLASFFW